MLFQSKLLKDDKICVAKKLIFKKSTPSQDIHAPRLVKMDGCQYDGVFKEANGIPVSEKKEYKSSYDISMKTSFKLERKNRKRALVEIKTDDHGKTFYGLSIDGNKVTLTGAYAYVTLATENGDKILAWPKSKDKHNDTAHFALSKYAPKVLYAGEVIFTPLRTFAASRCEQFNNASGCYKPHERYKEQAGLPVDKFVMPTFSF